MIALYPATELEIEHMWQWRNDVAFRRAHPDTHGQSLAEFRAWFAWAIENGTHIYLIQTDLAGEYIGYLHWNIESRIMWIVVDRTKRSVGYGKQAIRKAVDMLKLQLGNDARMVAWIKPENYRGLLAFESAGFEEKAMTQGSPQFVIMESK